MKFKNWINLKGNSYWVIICLQAHFNALNEQRMKISFGLRGLIGDIYIYIYVYIYRTVGCMKCNVRSPLIC
jgi:hypothetical protein